MSKWKEAVKKVGLFFTAAAVALGSTAFPVFASSDMSAAADTGTRTIAFKGAEGGGMYSSGARGALDEGGQIEVYHVTNLNDSGDGSFRDAVSQGNRIVVFDVSGYIDLGSNVTIGHDNITILGQTAPGDGVCFRSNNIKVGANNVILRYLRFRVGAHDVNGNDTKAQDGLEVTDNCENVIIDHCSVSWGTDENLSAYAVKNVTIQYSIIAEALNRSVHDKGEHSYAAIWGGVNLSVHHNLISTHKSRNPKIGTSESVAMTEGYTDAQTLVDIKNNVIYNWGDKAGYGTENGAKTYLQNNIYRPGPATPTGKRARIFELSVGQKYQTNMLGSVYAVGNKIDVDENDPDYKTAQIVNADNWQDDLHAGVYVDAGYYNLTDKSNMKITTPDAQYQAYEAEYPITLDATEDVFDEVINNAGATLPTRDKVDERIISNVVNRTAPSGSSGSVGLLDDPIDGIPAGEEAGYDNRGYPVLSEVSRDASYDTDRDGIPDEWEDKMGLNKSNPLDGVNIGPDGLTWLEIYVEEAITNPSEEVDVTVQAFNDVYTDSDTVELKAAVGTDTETAITSYENGIVSVRMGEGFAGGVAIACSYDENGALVDSKYADVDMATGTANVGAVTPASKTRVFLWNSLDAMAPLCHEYTGTATGDASDVAFVEFYCNDKVVATADKNQSGIWTASASKLPAGDNSIVAKAVNADGSYTLSALVQLRVIGSQAVDGWTVSGKAAYDGESYTMADASSLLRQVSGDFKLVTRIDNISNRVSGVVTGLSVTGAGGEQFEIGKTYSDEFEQRIYATGNQAWTGASPAEKYTYFEIERSGDTVILYAGTSLADLEDNAVGEYSVSSGTLSAGAFVSNNNSGTSAAATVSKLGVLQLVQGQSNPKIEIVNIKDNDRLDLVSSSVDVKLTADNSNKITEVWVYMNGVPIASENVEVSSEEVVNIPLTFAEPMSGTLSVYCFDTQLGKGEQSVDIVVSQNAQPWLLEDIGYSDGQAQTYALVTSDYTFKLYSAPGGNIGGTADKFGYMCQRFTGDNRIYYRSRLQTSNQFGVVFKSDLSDNGITYYFGGNTGDDGTVKYQLMARRSAGAEMEVVSDVTSVTGSTSTLYIIAEKAGDMINIYQTENGATVYNTKTLLASVKADGIGDTYYMGFAVTGDNDGDYADSGWVGIEGIGASGADWNFDYGLDWLWEMQESNVLKPSWTSGIKGNETGIMALEQPDDYESGRYVFREYQMSEDYVPSFSADVLLTGDEPGLNIYMQTGDTDKAYKITFADDGKIYTNGSTEAGSWSSSDGWYNISVATDIDTTGSVAASLTVTKTDGTAVVDNQPIEISGTDEFRTQNNVEKKTPVTRAVYFEPAVGASGKYYIDNVTVTAAEPSVKVERTASWYTFKGITALNGAFTVNGTTTSDGDELSGEVMSVASGAASLVPKSYNVAGVAFSARIRLNKNKAGALTVPVKSGSTVTVYCGSANSSSTRSLFINGAEYSVLSADAYKYTYDGEPGTIEIYAADGIDVYGVAVETVSVIQ